MKVINSIQGTVAVSFSPDEVAPESSVLSRDVVAYLGETYNFSVKPEVPPGLLVNPVFVFQAGQLLVGDKKVTINQLGIALQVGVVAVTAKNTDTAETVLSHIIGTVDAQFGFKIAVKVRERYYQSNLTIEFDPPLEHQLRTFERIQRVLETEIPRPGNPFSIKRIAFGSLNFDQQVQSGVVTSIAELRNTDFMMERRATEPLSANRYFTSAPVSTREHERILELVERTLQG